MQKNSDSFITNNDRAFILKALKEDQRLDGRQPYDFRDVKFEFSLDDRTATVSLGTTRVLSAIFAALEAPYPDRPTEGSIRFNVELGPMASPAFDSGRPGEDAVEIARLIERGLKQSHAVDTEALCVLAGRKVWSLRVDTHVLDHGGNLVDAACLSALAAFMVFRKPEVSVGGSSGTEVVVHSPEVKEPLPLTIHHLPVSVTFALFEGGELIAVDPALREEAAMSGCCTIMVNPNKEVCAVHKAGGVGLSTSQFMRCVRLACNQAEVLVAELKKALEQHDVARVQARIRRHRQLPAGAPGAGAAGMGAGPHVATMTAPAGTAGLAEAEEKLAAELGIKLDTVVDDVSSSSEEGSEAGSSSDGEDAEGGAMQVDRPGKAAAQSTAGASGKQGGEAAKAGGGATPGSKGGARLAGSIKAEASGKQAKSQAQAAKAKAEQPAQPGSAGRSAPGSAGRSKRTHDVKFDELDEIAALIAGASDKGGKEEEEVADLSAAIKPKKKGSGPAKKAKSEK